MKKLRVTVEGKSYDVLVEILDAGTPPPATVSASPAAPAVVSASLSAPVAAAAPARAAAGGPGDVTSPLAGKLVSIDVKIGQTVAEGAQVATVEAMKMNTYIFAPKAGQVSAVLATPGEGVEEGSVLLQIV